MKGDVSGETSHLALRADFEHVLARHFYPFASVTGHARSVANELIHLVVLHGLLPETETS